MKSYELAAMRKHMTLDVTDCATFIGKVSARTWQYWESGTYAVPQDVFEAMIELKRIRDVMYAKIVDVNEGDNPDAPSLQYFHSVEDYLAKHSGHTQIEYKLYQSVICQAFYERRAYLYEAAKVETGRA